MANSKLTAAICLCTPQAALANHFILNKLDRLVETHATDHDKVVVKGTNLFPLLVGSSWYLLDTDVNVSTSADIDTGSIAAATDYYVYACDDSGTMVFKISANSTFPSGFTADTSRKIGGFHTLCVNIGTISGHTLTGYLANDILPASIWDLKHRPYSEPEGMVYDSKINKWVDIYLASGTGANTASVNGATISDTRDWMDFVDDGHAVKKRLLSDEEFQSVAAGSNEETNIFGSANPNTTGGHSDTASRRMISNIGCEDCVGAMYHWLLDQSFKSDYVTGWGWYNLPGSKGSLYNQDGINGRADVKLLAGGFWDHGANTGSRCRSATYYRWLTPTNIGARFLAEPL